MTNIHGGHFIAGAWQRGDSGFTPEYPGGDGGRVDHFFNANEDTVAAAVAAAAAAAPAYAQTATGERAAFLKATVRYAI